MHTYAVAQGNANIDATPDRRSYSYGAPPCRIYRPAASPMQWRGIRPTRWRLAFAPVSPPAVEPLMRWTSSEDPFAQTRLTFPTRTAAIDYAERYGLDYQIAE
jgi:hypothetical protein